MASWPSCRGAWSKRCERILGDIQMRGLPWESKNRPFIKSTRSNTCDVFTDFKIKLSEFNPSSYNVSEFVVNSLNISEPLIFPLCQMRSVRYTHVIFTKNKLENALRNCFKLLYYTVFFYPFIIPNFSFFFFF